MPQECQALLIDFDGVLRVWPEHDTHIESSCGLPGGSIHRVAFEPGLLTRAITGQISDDQWRQEVARRLFERFPEAQVTAAVEEWSLPAGAIDLAVLDILAAARERVRVVLVTNATSRLDRDLQTLGLQDFFHAVANSSVIGAAKPHPDMFRAALSLAGVSAELALFVDDSSENVAGATALGIRSQLYRGHAALRELLRSNGVLAPSAICGTASG